MHIYLERSNLIKALSHTQSIVEKRNTQAILANVKMVCDDGALTITATDMGIAAREIISSVDIATPGAITVPAHTLHDIVRKLPEGCQIEMKTVDGDYLSIKSGLSAFNLPALPADQFPNFDTGTATSRFTIEAKGLLNLLQRTKHAISPEETRYYLTGVHLHIVTKHQHSVLRAVATDTHRLSMAEIKAPSGAATMPGIIMPRKTVFELIKLLENYDELVDVQVAINKITFTIGATTLTSKLVDSKYPDYEVTIPQHNSSMLKLSTKNLARAINLVISISADKTKAVVLDLQPNQLNVSAHNENDNASGFEVLDAAYDGKPCRIGFNSRYLMDTLAATDSEMVQFLMSDNDEEAVIVRDAEDSSYMHILMPIKV